ncbi:hypothetical protein SAMN05216326_11090 [Nitrosomonas marina]|uniref:PEP-CTERM sorting domain-containing protein n=1 Tax=Nitrosomonas marina TaxID=917 RepID=A0A1I0BFI9_9PROT|nr:hypothetical protein [Nitrosomonas marina]SET05624.1 hypothetical protein SAMN05216326_11090 [Nitrosomonas marina]
MKKLFSIFTLLFAGQLNAAVITGFVGPYKESNWNISYNEQYVDITGFSNESIALQIGNPTSSFIHGNLYLTTVAKDNGLVTFDLLIGDISDHSFALSDESVDGRLYGEIQAYTFVSDL